MSYTTKEIHEAWVRLGATPDGKIARELLLRKVKYVIPVTQNAGALHIDLGERTFANSLLALMDTEARLPDGREQPDTVNPVAKPVRVASGHGLGRRVPIDPEIPLTDADAAARARNSRGRP